MMQLYNYKTGDPNIPALQDALLESLANLHGSHKIQPSLGLMSSLNQNPLLSNHSVLKFLATLENHCDCKKKENKKLKENKKM